MVISKCIKLSKKSDTDIIYDQDFYLIYALIQEITTAKNTLYNIQRAGKIQSGRIRDILTIL